MLFSRFNSFCGLGDEQTLGVLRTSDSLSSQPLNGGSNAPTHITTSLARLYNQAEMESRSCDHADTRFLISCVIRV